MVYDVLFATDAKFQVQPQMVTSGSQQGQPDLHLHAARRAEVPRRPAGALGRLHRLGRALGKRDVFGQRLAEMTESWTAVNDKTFRLKLKKPFPYVLEALGKPSSNVPFIMPERIAKTDASKQIEIRRLRPFKMVKAEWVPGNKVVYVKNTDYVPRKEPPSWGAGARCQGRPGRVDLHPDAATAAAALNGGEVDWWQQVPADLVPIVAKNKSIKVESVDPLGSIGLLRSTTCSRRSTTRRCGRRCWPCLSRRTTRSPSPAATRRTQALPSYFTCGTPMANTAAPRR